LDGPVHALVVVTDAGKPGMYSRLPDNRQGNICEVERNAGGGFRPRKEWRPVEKQHNGQDH